MRLLEIALAALTGIYLLWPLIAGRGRPRAVAALPFLAAMLLLVHLALERPRWQMVPIYGLTLGTCLAAIGSARHAQAGPFVRRSWAGITLAGFSIVTAAAAALPALLPVPRVPAPSGPYAVGTMTMEVVDSAREEIYSDQPGEPRRFLIQVWYPALPDPGVRPGPWMANADIVAPAIAEWLDLPRYFLDHLELVRTDSYPEAPADPLGAPYPLLVFSHGWGGFRAQNGYLMQELASHGYVVVGMEHTYGAAVTVFSDGDVAYNNPAALPEDLPDAEYDQAARRLVQQWIGDMATALDFLEAGNRGQPAGLLTGMLDPGAVGVMGHSTGGAAAVEFCTADPRCDAGLGMDVWMTPVTEETLALGGSQPFLFLFSEQWPTAKNQGLFGQLRQNSNPSDRAITILGSDHYDFTDLPALTPLAHALGLKGPIAGTRVQHIVITYVQAFFDAELKGEATSLLDGPSVAFPEVRFDG